MFFVCFRVLPRVVNSLAYDNLLGALNGMLFLIMFTPVAPPLLGDILAFKV